MMAMVRISKFITCNQCGAELAVIKKCGRCDSTTYCDAVCQKKHWHNYHKYECRKTSKSVRMHVDTEQQKDMDEFGPYLQSRIFLMAYRKIRDGDQHSQYVLFNNYITEIVDIDQSLKEEQSDEHLDVLMTIKYKMSIMDSNYRMVLIVKRGGIDWSYMEVCNNV
jgi:hypothetical protein